MALLGWSYTSLVILLGIIMFFLIAVCNKWLNDFGLIYNKWIAWFAGLVSYFLIAYMWALKPAFGIGFGASLAGGILGGMFLGETPSGE